MMNTISQRIKIFSLVIMLMAIAGCEKELSLTEFQKDFGFYTPELRVEAILDAANPEKSIVRLDRSITIDDTTVYNGRDDDGDWRIFSDLNNNGQWDSGEPLNDDVGRDGMPANEYLPRDEGEGNGRPDPGEPHVDEYDEILPHLHDSTATIILRNIQTDLPDYGQTINFVWNPRADSFQTVREQQENSEETTILETVVYGGYCPLGNNVIHDNCEYEISINSQTFGLIITGSTHTIPPVEFLTDFPIYPATMVGDTMVFTYNAGGMVFWESDPRGAVYYIKIEKVERPDSLVLMYDYSDYPLEDLKDYNQGRPVGVIPIIAEIVPGLYLLTVSALDENYGRYYYSNLPLKDPQKTNLRDQDGNPVMGVFGSQASKSIFIRINQIEDLILLESSP
jgi:hypothetical protein